MRALTLTQPWAEAVACGMKQWETRGWRTSYRGPLAIHAAVGFPRGAREFASVERALGRLPSRVPRGAIVAVAELVDIRPTEEVVLEIGAIERLYGDYSPGRYAWQLAAVRRLEEPIPCRGMLGLWTPDAAVVAEAMR